MRPNTQLITQQGDLGGEKVAMSFDENSIAHLMGVLSDLYSNPELAVVREYSTNALDSHKEAGNTAPIEIETPNRLSPFFKVKDYGVGMTAEDIRNTYSKYGASTKRGTNSQTGMLGLGCKSALTYTSQFTVIGVKDGIKTQVSISRSADGGGVMEVIDETPTDLPNGVEVSIPAQRYHQFDNTVKEFFRYWDIDSVLINGESRKPNDFIKINDELYLDSHRTHGPDMMVMGNIAYPLEQRLNSNFKYPVILYVPIGSVDFTPSREQLHNTPRTVAFIDQAKADALNIAEKYINNALASAKNKSDALIQASKLHNVFHRQSVMWQKEIVPTNFSIDYAWKTKGEGYSTNKYYSFIPHEKIVTNFNCVSVSPNQKKKITAWKKLNNIDESVTLTLIDSLPKNPWLENFPTVDWKDINAIQLPKASKAPVKKRVAQPQEVMNFDDMTYTTTPDKSKDLVYWFKSNKINNWSYDPQRSLLKNAVVAEIQPRQENSFKKKNPNAMPVRDYIKKKIKELVDTLPSNPPVTVLLAPEDERWAYNKRIEDYDDPELKNIIARHRESRNGVDPAVKRIDEIIDLAVRWGIPCQYKNQKVNQPSVIVKKYNFVLGAYNSGAMIQPMNAMYHHFYKN